MRDKEPDPKGDAKGKLFFMIIVHETFVCKPGNASKMAKMFKNAMGESGEVLHVMTDVTGQYNRVVIVSKYESLTAYDQNWEKFKQDAEAMKKMQEAMAGYQEMYLSGSREIFQVW